MSVSERYCLTRHYYWLLYPILLDLQLGCCADCGEEHEKMEIDHKKYGADISIKDLQLLCNACHFVKTGESHDMYLSGGRHCYSCTCSQI